MDYDAMFMRRFTVLVSLVLLSAAGVGALVGWVASF